MKTNSRRQSKRKNQTSSGEVLALSSKVAVRGDIQLLRAVAVLAVVLYHSGIPLQGGFLGVDMFFVISGFVIMASLMRELDRSGVISWKSFFMRRIRRLTPALGAVLAATLVLSFILQSPFGMMQITAQTAIGASALIANLVIFSNSGGYFDPAAELNPLLHTWSLSVEEQFYILLPIAILIALRLGLRGMNFRHLFGVILATVSLLSFTLMIFYNSGGYFPGADFLLGFYGPVGRAWEFGVGALLALVPHHRLMGIQKEIVLALTVAGWGAISSSLLLVSSEQMVPGLPTLLPTLGTACLIAAGSKQEQMSAGVWSRGAVSVGNWSYSIYLWHWPFIVFFTLLDPENAWLPGLGALVSLFPALVSYYTIERRFRYKVGFGRKDALRVVSLFAIIPIGLASLVWLVASQLLQPHFSESEQFGALKGTILHDTFHDEIDRAFFPCLPQERYLASENWESVIRCHQSKETGPAEIAILGDSHAEQLFFGVATVANSKNVSYWLQSSTQPALPGEPRMVSYIHQIAESATIESVIITAHWQDNPFDSTGVENTIRLLTDAGKTVIAIEDNPRFPFEADRCKYGLGGIVHFTTTCEISATVPVTNRNRYMPDLYQLERRYPGFFVVATMQEFCREEQCSMKRGDEIWYRDNNHLNTIGSLGLVTSLVESDRRLARVLGTTGSG